MALIKPHFWLAVVTLTFILILNLSNALYSGRRQYRRTFFRRPGAYGTFLRQAALVYEKAKVETLGDIFKRHVQHLRHANNRQVELVFLLDSSGTVGRHYFFEEISFVRNLLSDFTVGENATRVSVITFSSPNKVFRPVDYLTKPSPDKHKCRLMKEDVPKVSYNPGGTYTLGALLEAESVLEHSRPGASKAIFLMTDGYSNGGDPRPVAARIKQKGVKIFTFGIRHGNVWELQDMASEPKNETCYIVDSFEEFEGLAKRALHADLQSGSYYQESLSKCEDLCQEESLCCHQNASCACGTYTGRYECLCAPGFYGTGRGQTGCTSCPSGTYKSYSGIGDVDVCTRCPDEHQTTPLGAVIVTQCVCKRGYRQFGPSQCAVFRCPKLSPPKNGYFVNNNTCKNVFNAACGLKCKHGYELVGSSVRICQDHGTWSGTDARCVMKTCPSLPAPRNGHMVCSSDDFSYSTNCRFTCNGGYQLVGSRSRTCLGIAQWTGIAPRCREITCAPLVKIRDGYIAPPSCSASDVIFGSTCYISCSAGYTLLGPHTKQCSPEGIWLAGDEGVNRCVDEQPPSLRCPDDVHVDADPIEETTEVIWTSPVPVDNSGFRPIMTTDPVVSPGSRLPHGVTTITYRAEDLSGNVAACTFSVLVNDITPPRVDSCVAPDPVVSATNRTSVGLPPPVFSDNSGRPVEVVPSHRSTFVFPYGKTRVSFNAFDAANNNITCSFDVEVVPHLCVQPNAPENGNQTCIEDKLGVTCSISCLPGFAFAVTPPSQEYSCIYSNGSWSPERFFPFPNCAVIQESNDMAQPATITVDDIACNDTHLLSQVKQSLIEAVSTELLAACGEDLDCQLGELEVFCDGEPAVNSSQSVHLAKSRRRRSVHDVHDTDEDADGDEVLESHSSTQVSFRLIIEGKQNSFRLNQSEVSRKLQRVVTSLQQDAQQGQLKLKVDGIDVDVSQLDYDPALGYVRCPHGSIRYDNNSCVNCPKGTYHDMERQECVACPQGTHQSSEAQLACSPCPQHSSTVDKGTTAKDLCLSKCRPGTYSMNGLEPCQSCPVGSYQHDAYSRGCNSCADGKTTRRRGCTFKDNCTELCPRGQVSDTGLSPCYSCPRGSYQPNQGQTQCLVCPQGGTTSTPASASVDNCIIVAIPWDIQSDDSSIELRRTWSDDLTVLDFDICFSEPCHNGGTCTRVQDTDLFTCSCPKGFTGQKCEGEINLCKSDPCLNDGECLRELNSYRCNCKSGFTGATCEVNVDDCASGPCQNKATCIDGIDGFTCRCRNGFTGPTCSLTVNSCAEEPCRNDGVCSNIPESDTTSAGFSCECADGFSGVSCEEDLNECLSSPCTNGATCRDMPGAFRCECVAGYSGRNCDEDINECAGDPCENAGECEDLLDSYKCKCHDGFSGKKCEKVLSSQYQLDFVTPTIMDYARMTFDRPISAVTVSLWVRTSDGTNQGTLFSYSVQGEPDTFTLTNYANLVLIINGEVKAIGSELNDGRWHHVVITWSSGRGDWKFYLDGLLNDQGYDLSTLRWIPGQGVFIIGQEQDSFGGSFSPAETFVGSITQLNVWDEELSLTEVEKLRLKCTSHHGNIVSWPDVQETLHGNVVRSPSPFCQDLARSYAFSWRRIYSMAAYH